jgi:hypothetical protein
MSGNQWVNYGIAIVIGIVVGVATAGVGLGAYAAFAGTLAFGVSSALLNANHAQKLGGTGGLKNAAAKDLEIASSSEAVSVTVTWGQVRIGGNFLRFDRSTFRTEAITQTQEVQGGGGKGGGDSEQSQTQTQIVGYRYYLSYLYGICMGPVDAISYVWDANEMKVVGAGNFFSGDVQSVVLTGSEFGGAINVYRGSETQARVSGDAYYNDGMNYRHVCFASFPDHWIGNQPTPRTILFEVLRWPVCLDAAGDPITGFRRQGSLTDAGRCWMDANPAAILYEVMTNEVWGRGLSPDFIDIPAFVAASEFFASNDIGISLALDAQQSIGDIVDFIRRHVNAAVVWTGELLTIRVLMNPADTQKPVIITTEQVTKPTLTRPTWPDTANELRLEFLNKANAWKAEIAHVQDTASFNTIGNINSQKVTLNGFTVRSLAEEQSSRILSEMGYPQATLTFYMNRWASKLVPGDRVQFVWSEFTAENLNTFWRVIEFNDNEQSQDGIRVVLAEDLYAVAYEGGEVSFTPVIPGFVGDVANSDDDLNLGEDANAAYEPGDLMPIRAFELPITMTLGTRQMAILCQRGSGGNLYASHSWRVGSEPFKSFAFTRGWAYTGKLATSIATSLSDLQRGPDAFTFDITLNNDDDEANFLSSASKVSLASDDMDVVLSGLTDLLVIGNEIFHIGKVTEITPNVYRCSNFLRAGMGTAQASHAINDDVHFIQAWDTAKFVVSQGSIPDAVDVDFRTNVGTPQSGLLATEFEWNGPNAGQLIGTGVRPFAPSYLEHSISGPTWTVAIRPRIHGAGAGYLSSLQDDFGVQITALPAGYSVLAQSYSDATTPSSERLSVPFTYVQDADGGSLTNGLATGGRVTFNLAAPGAHHVRVWLAFNGQPSLDHLSISP